MIARKLLIGYLFIPLCISVTRSVINIRTKARFKNVEVFEHFWKSTGFSPETESESERTFVLTEDEKLNLDYIGALPNQGIKMVRIHWILDLVTVSNIQSEEPVFHFENLDELIHRLHLNGLSPSFELMGNPSNFFRNFGVQSKHWISLIQQIMQRYSNLYGAAYVHTWIFELLNEPDLKQYNIYNFTLEQYLDYFRASEAAVPGLAGPAGLFRNPKNHPLCWGLLDYCNSQLCNLDMITFHRKGDGVGSQVVQGSLDLIDTIISKYPNLKGIPFGNDEADILTGWYKPEKWRADVRYAALVAQVIIGHIQLFVARKIPFGMLSNDNAFLSFSPDFFTLRTLLARFHTKDTSPYHVHFFRKPVYSVMALLSLLGDQLRDIVYQPGEKGFSYLLTSHGYEDTFLGVIANDRVEDEEYTMGNGSYVDASVRIALGNLTLSGISVGYIMDNDRSNPYRVWMEAGKPFFPDSELRRRMREEEGFKRMFIRKVKPHQRRVKFYISDLWVPSVFAVHVCYEGIEKPGEIIDLRYAKMTPHEIVLFWKDDEVNSRCILTYVIEFRKAGDSQFHRVNRYDSIFLSYHHDGLDQNGTKVGIFGDYRVAAVDYWNRTGPFSDILSVV